MVGEVGDGQQSGMTALGDTVNLASRIETAATAGTVLLSAETQALVDGFVNSSCIGARELKGKSQPQELWRLDGLQEGVARFDIVKSHGLTPLVGRGAELDHFNGLCRETSQGGHRQVAPGL